MSSRRRIVLVTLAFVALTGCDQGSRIIGLGGSGGATVRFVNATTVALDLTANGQVVGGNGRIPAGTSTSCLPVDPTNTTVGIRQFNGTTDIPGFTPTFTVGRTYTVVVFSGGTGATQTVTMLDAFIPHSGLSGLRIFDAASATGPLDVYVTAPGAPLSVPSSASIGFAGSTGFFEVNPGANQVRFTVATTPIPAFDAGTITLVPGQSSTLVLVPVAGSFIPTAVLLPAC